MFLRSLVTCFLFLCGGISTAYGDFSFEDPGLTSPDCGFAYNPQYYGICSPCDGILDRTTFRIDYLYWNATEDGLSLGTVETVKSSTTGQRSDQAHTANLDFEMSSGVRLGALYLLPCDGWDLSLNWTGYSSDASKSGHSAHSSISNTVFITNWEHFNEIDRLESQEPTQIVAFVPDQIKGKWNLDLNLVDLELARKCYLSPCLLARPFIGLRFANIDQTYKIQSYSNPNPDPTVGNYVANSKAKCDFTGLGLLAGFDLEYKLGCGFSLFGRAAGSIVYGSFHLKEQEDVDLIFPSQTLPGNSTFVPAFYKSHSNVSRSRAMSDLALGFKWEDSFCGCDHYFPVQVALAWEHHAFFRMNEFRFARLLNDRELLSDKDGDLMTQGLTVSLSVGF